ncbi:MAG: TonB-dependent receptor [Prolixibacteraceae bacterium]
MKKNYSDWGEFCHSLKKTLLIMRLVIVLLLVGFLQTYANDTYAQKTRISVSFTNTQLAKVLDQIENESEFFFLYNEKLIDANRRVSIDAKDERIDEILKALFYGTDVEYTITDRKIILAPSNFSETQQFTKKISGKVTDSSGATLPGVSVVVKGSTTGVITGNDGNFSLTIPSDAKILLFSFVGMKSQEVAIGNQTTINITLSEETIGLEEVVAIGYGTVKKSDLTGAIASVKMKDASKNANTNVMQALQGSVPGLNIGAVTTAGGDPSILIRGYKSLSAGQTPLIVVDGIIFSGSISDISTNDIERVDVLKDASSAAVYGSRSANGVIIITTKKGTSEKPVIEFNTFHGVQQMAHRVQMADGDKYVQKILDYRAATGLQADPTKVVNYLQPLEVENYKNKTYTNWYDLLTRTAPIDQYELSVSGKTNKTNYFLSGSYTDQAGVVIGDDFTRSTLRANFSNEINNWLTIGMNTSYSHRDYSGAAVDFGPIGAFASPLSTVYSNKETGELNLFPQTDQLIINPLSLAKAQDAETQDNLFAILFADIQILKVNGLKFHFDYSNGLQFYKHNQFSGLDTYAGINAPKGLATKATSELRNWSINNILSYSKKINKHAIDATVLYTKEGATAQSTNTNVKNFPNLALGWNALQLGTVNTSSSNASESSSEGFMVRASYGFDLKYLLTATFRRDGYSGFSQGNKYANFPSASLAWVISEENFAKTQKWLSNLKLRLSYGVNGNQALGPYGSLSQMSMLNYVYGDGGSTSIGTYPNSLANSDLTWEKTAQTNIGLTFGVLKNRISGDIDIYKGTTKDLLVKRSLPTMTGFTNVWTNLGELENKGIEMSLSTINISRNNLTWESKFSFSLNRNKISHLYGTDANKDGIEDDDIGNSWFIGKSFGAIYNFTTDGIYQINEANIPTGWKPGDVRLKDTNGDGNISTSDRSVIGYSVPNYRFGIYNELKYKNISLTFMINSIQGGGKNNYYIIDNSWGLNPNYWTGTASQRVNIPDINYWTPTNPTNKIPRLDYMPKYTHGMYEDRSFVRLDDITLSYNFNQSIFKKLNINALKLYVTGKNLYTWTKFTGWDPEAGTEIGQGYPGMREIVAGLNINF